MSQSPILGKDADVDVSTNDHSNTSPQINPADTQTVYAVDPAVGHNRDIAKSVKLSGGKRRKVVPGDACSPPGVRQTRYGAGKRQGSKTFKTKPSKNIRVEQIKNAAKSTRQKRLHHTFDLHDTKVRELFHLTKFVTLVDYDAEAAKGDESEVFKEVSSRRLFDGSFCVVQTTLRLVAESGRRKIWWTSAVNPACYQYVKGPSRSCVYGSAAFKTFSINSHCREGQTSWWCRFSIFRPVQEISAEFGPTCAEWCCV